jgi:hypothetical protein
MHQFNPSNPTSRPILKLKIGARKSPRETKNLPPPKQTTNSKLKPGARWSDG